MAVSDQNGAIASGRRDRMNTMLDPEYQEASANRQAKSYSSNFNGSFMPMARWPSGPRRWNQVNSYT